MARPWLIAWLLLLVSALALTALVAWDGAPDETALVRDVQGWPLPGEAVSDAVRAVTGTLFVAAVALVIAGAHWLARQRCAAVVLLLLLVAVVAVQSGLKALVDRPRPPDAGIEARAAYDSPSYPAGHVMGPAAIYTWALVALLARPSRTTAAVARGALAITLTVVLLLTGVVNVYLGVHWPTDVAGGYVWGLVLALPALGFAGLLPRPP